MRKTNIAIFATAALGLCLIGPKGTSAFPAADGSGKIYAQTAIGKSAASPVRWGGRVGGVGFRGAGWRGGGLGWRGAGWRGAGWRGAAWRGAGWRGRGGYYGGWGWPVGLGLGLGVAATDWGWGYPSYGGYYSGWGWPVGYGLGIGTGGWGYRRCSCNC
jgi:hypothetical protein